MLEPPRTAAQPHAEVRLLVGSLQDLALRCRIDGDARTGAVLENVSLLLEAAFPLAAPPRSVAV